MPKCLHYIIKLSIRNHKLQLWLKFDLLRLPYIPDSLYQSDYPTVSRPLRLCSNNVAVYSDIINYVNQITVKISPKF